MTEREPEKTPARRSAIPKALAAAEAPVVLSLAVYLLLTGIGTIPPLAGLHISLYLLWPLAAAGLALFARRQQPLMIAPTSLLLGAVVLGATFYVNFRAVRVEGESMMPTLQPGDVLLMDLTARPDNDRYSVYVLNVENEDHNPLIKRLVGLPGETMDVRFGRVFADDLEVFPRDGTASDEWNHTRPANARFYSGGRLLGSDEYFFLGDNPPDSRDSRAFGGVTHSEMEGRVIWSLRGSHGFGTID